MKRYLYFLLLVLLVSSCGVFKQKYLIQTQHDTLTVYQNINTTLYDSVYVYKDRNIYIKGDTVYTTVVEYKDRWKIKEVHDTLYKDKAVFVDRDVPIEVEKKLSWSQKMFLAFGKIFSVLLLIGIGYLVAKFLIK